mgnify:CR=1 FL=1
MNIRYPIYEGVYRILTDKRRAGAFNPAGLPAAGGFIGRARLCFGRPKPLALLIAKSNFSRWSQFLRYHLKKKRMTEIRNKTGGRPAKSRIDKQNRVVSTKLTELQYYAIKKRAGESGLPISEYVRQAVVSAEVTPRLNKQDADTIRKLAGEANNLNQLAHCANAGGFALVAVELVKLKNRIIEIINQLSDDWKNKKGKRI